MLFMLLSATAAAQANIAEPKSGHSRAGAGGLKIGVVPYSGGKRAISAWLPLASFLREKLQQPVLIVTAPNHKEFYNRIQEGRYFLIVSSPHVAAAMIRHDQAIPVRMLTIPISARLVVRRDSPFTSLLSLNGKSISTTTAGAFTSLLLEHEIKLISQQQPFSVNTRYGNSHAEALRNLLNNRTDAAYVSKLPHTKSTVEQFETLKIIEHSSITSHPMIITPASLGTSHAAAMGLLLDQFAEQASPANPGLSPFSGDPRFTFRPIKQAVLDQLTPLVVTWLKQR